MRKTGIRLTFVLALLVGSGNTVLKAQTVHQGRIFVDLYHGFPNLWTASLRTIVNQEAVPIELETRSVGPVGGRVEVLLSDRFGLGLDIFYARSEVAFSAEGTDLDGNPATYAYNVSLPRPRVLLRGNFHLGQSEIVDPYLTLGLGYSGTKVRIETDDPIFQQNQFNLPIFLPVAGRLGFGTRVMLTRFVDLSAEIGLGGPLLTAGLSVGI